MVAILPQFDPGGQAGQQIGQGIQQTLNMLGQRKMQMGALDKLRDISTKDLQGMSLPQRMATLIEPFAGIPGGNALAAEIVPSMMKFIGDIQEVQPGSEDVDLATGGSSRFGPRQDVPTGGPTGVPSTPGAQSVQSTVGIPLDMPGEFKNIIQTYPEYRAMATRGNPLGLNPQQQQSMVTDLVKRGAVPRQQAEQRVQRFSDHLRAQHDVYQNLNNTVSSEARELYGSSPFYNMMERKMLSVVDQQIESGRTEPNSVKNVARQAGKNLETVMNNAPSAKGRQWFGDNKDRKRQSGNWIGSVSNTDPQTAVELLMQPTLEVVGKNGEPETTAGPDWGAVRATEISHTSGGRPEVIKSALDIGKSLPGIEMTYDPRMEGSKERRDQRVESGMKVLEDALVNLKPEDSLVLVRAAAKKKGYDEDRFRVALENAKQRRQSEFSPYQNWEESQLLLNDIRPSPYELLFDYRTFGDTITGKY